MAETQIREQAREKEQARDKARGFLEQSFGDYEDFVLRTRGTVYTVITEILRSETGKIARSDVRSIMYMVYAPLMADEGQGLAELADQGRDMLDALNRFTRKVAMQYVRGRYYHETPMSRIFSLLGVDPGEASPLIDLYDDVLSSTQKVVLRVRYGENRDIDDCARLLGVTPRVIRTIEAEAVDALAAMCTAMPDNVSLH